MQEIQPSGPNGATVTLGDYVRDLLLEQVSGCCMCVTIYDTSSCSALQSTAELLLLAMPDISFAWWWWLNCQQELLQQQVLQHRGSMLLWPRYVPEGGTHR